MHPIPNTSTFRSLFEQSGMTQRQFGESIGIYREDTMRALLNGKIAVSDGHVADALQLLEDISWWKTHFIAQEKSGVPIPNIHILKKSLDEIEKEL